MRKIHFVLPVIAGLATVCYLGGYCCQSPTLPVMDPNPYWGPGEPPAQEDISVRHFVINTPQQDVDDLAARLSLPHRLLPSLENTNFTYGVNSETMASIFDHWRNKYDWRARERRLNKLMHYKTRIEGLDIHFVRATPAAGSGKIVRPLLMVHGWPGSVVEFFDIIPLLTTPRPDSDVVFDVICPSLPGYGFSSASAKPGLSTVEMSQIFVKLMNRLGFNKFYAQGGDWGSVIVSNIATLLPDSLYGAHMSMVSAGSTLLTSLKMAAGAYLPSGSLVPVEQERLFYPFLHTLGRLLRETGYLHLQATKPDTIGVALNSSPQGLAAYILEKFSSWTDMDNLAKKDGGLLDPHFPISLDAILDNICIYWFTGTITSSMRLYAENFNPRSKFDQVSRVPTAAPVGLAGYPEDIFVIPRVFVQHKYTNILTYSTPRRGGHFAAMERPSDFAADLMAFVKAAEAFNVASAAAR